jgi:hypothetical protein
LTLIFSPTLGVNLLLLPNLHDLPEAPPHVCLHFLLAVPAVLSLFFLFLALSSPFAVLQFLLSKVFSNCSNCSYHIIIPVLAVNLMIKLLNPIFILTSSFNFYLSCLPLSVIVSLITVIFTIFPLNISSPLLSVILLCTHSLNLFLHLSIFAFLLFMSAGSI